MFIKTKGLTSPDHNPWLVPSQVFDSSVISGLAHCSLFPSSSELLSFPSWTISALSSSNEGLNSGMSSRTLFLTSWKFSTLSCQFLASSEDSTTNYWVTSMMHPFGLDTTKEFHFESSMASTWFIYRYFVWTIGRNSSSSFLATIWASYSALRSLSSCWILSNFSCCSSGCRVLSYYSLSDWIFKRNSSKMFGCALKWFPSNH